jgi:hypothetical protein
MIEWIRKRRSRLYLAQKLGLLSGSGRIDSAQSRVPFDLRTDRVGGHVAGHGGLDLGDKPNEKRKNSYDEQDIYASGCGYREDGAGGGEQRAR